MSPTNTWSRSARRQSPTVQLDGWEIAPGATIALLLQGVTGKLEQPLDAKNIQAGRNVLTIEGTPTEARIRVAVPPGVRKRSAFNGLAPVMVQSTKQPGDIILAGSSPDLASGVLKLRTTPSALRPAVPEDQETQCESSQFSYQPFS